MQGRSIRSMTLAYYRQQGAEIRPLAEGAAYEIIPPDGAALKITFDGESEELPVTSTSPQWRQIVEELTSELAVSYRYLVTGPIGNPAATLQALMPRDWQVAKAKFLKAEVRQALGVSHRVTFDSPALNVRQEMLHHHVWDLETESRLPGLEPMLYTAPCLLIRPDRQPTERETERLVEQSLMLVDQATDARGHEIERELEELLLEAEKRTNAYFDQQMNNVLQREIQLTEKLDTAIRKLGEAKTPEQIQRYRQDGQSLEAQLAELKARREQDLAAVEAACQRKLLEEREKHELTAMTDLVALCHTTYDVLSYDALVVDPNGREATWRVRLWPVMRKLELPACPYCQRAMTEPTIFEGGEWACKTCVRTCGGCGTTHPPDAFERVGCGTCRTDVCPACETRCTHCGTASCTRHELGCGTCEAPVCRGCARHCAGCETELCQSHAAQHPVDGLWYCAEHYEAATARFEAAPAPEPEPEVAAVVFAPEPELPEAIYVTESVACDTEPAIEAIYDEEALTEEPAAPVARPERVVSKLSGKEIPAAKAETCHACAGDYEVQEMVDCPTCGVPTCKPCTEGEYGPCPACGSLEKVAADSALLGFVFTTYPDLARHRRRWEAFQLGPYVVTMWKRLGRWGMVTYHTGGPEPVVVTEFSMGPVETVRTRLGAWLGGR